MSGAAQLPLAGLEAEPQPYRLPWLRCEFLCAERDARPVFKSPAHLGEWCFAEGLDRPGDEREWFWLLAVDTRNRLIGEPYPASIGCLSASFVHPREVFRFALAVGARGLILAHNHPSGDPEPSAEDVSLTRRLKAGGDLLGVEVMDHLVLGTGTGRFVSMKERGTL